MDAEAYFEHHCARAVPAAGHDLFLEWLDLSAGERVLDVGCGLGALAAAMSRCGAEVVGVDSSPAAIQYAQRSWPGVAFAVMDGLELDQQFGAGSFDAITCVQVLEHVRPDSVGLFIGQLAECLRDEGRLLIDVPVTDNPSDRWLTFRNRLLRQERGPAGAIDSSLNPTHLWKLGDVETLTARFAAHGLQAAKVRRLYYVPWMLERLHGGHLARRLPAPWLRQLLKGATILFRKSRPGEVSEEAAFSAFWADPPGTRGLARLKKVVA